jgi:hypothetical protein
MERANLRSPLLERAGFVVNETVALKKVLCGRFDPGEKKEIGNAALASTPPSEDGTNR